MTSDHSLDKGGGAGARHLVFLVAREAETGRLKIYHVP